MLGIRRDRHGNFGQDVTIATLADNHFIISKKEIDGRAHTSIKALSYEERVEEAARILGGINITEAQRQAARDMLDNKNE